MSDDNGSGTAGQPGDSAGNTGAPSWFAMDGMAPDQVNQLGEMVKAKGWKHPSEALMSYQNLEKVFGADKAGRTILAPKGDDDVEGWNSVYNRLGRPESPDKYELPVPEGQDRSFADAFAPVFHEYGLTNKQAKGIAEKWNELSGAMMEQQEAAFQQKVDAEYSALQKEWGMAAAQNEEIARRAAIQFSKKAGIDEATFDAMERSIGTAKLIKLFHEIGSSFQEGTFVSGDMSTGGKMTPAQADAKIKAKFTDNDFMARYMNQDPKIRQGAIDEMMELQRMANPELFTS